MVFQHSQDVRVFLDEQYLNRDDRSVENCAFALCAKDPRSFKIQNITNFCLLVHPLIFQSTDSQRFWRLDRIL